MLTFISDELDVFSMVSLYDYRRSCIASYNYKMQFEYSMGTEIQEILNSTLSRIVKICELAFLQEVTPPTLAALQLVFRPPVTDLTRNMDGDGP